MLDPEQPTSSATAAEPEPEPSEQTGADYPAAEDGHPAVLDLRPEPISRLPVTEPVEITEPTAHDRGGGNDQDGGNYQDGGERPSD